MAFRQDNGNNVLLYSATKENAEVLTDHIPRWGYDTQTIYVENPDGLAITLQLAPDGKGDEGQTWFEPESPKTDVKFMMQVNYLCKFLRFKIGTGVGTVKIRVISGDLTHT